MNKALYNFTKSKLDKLRSGGKIKWSISCQRLHDDYGFGTLTYEGKNEYLVFNSDDRAALIRTIINEHGLDLVIDDYSFEKSRAENAKHHRNEKVNSYAVSKDFILVNTLTDFRLNGERFAKAPLSSLGHYIKADEIISIEHRQIVLVENLTIMANLAALNLPSALQEALWLYRGDLKSQQQTGTAYHFFRRFGQQDTTIGKDELPKHQMICFSDFDPKGIEIALTCGADYWLTIDDNTVINIELTGSEKDWFDQTGAKTFLTKHPLLPDKCQQAFQIMNDSKKTFKQEHMLSHQTSLALFTL